MIECRLNQIQALDPVRNKQKIDRIKKEIELLKQNERYKINQEE